MAVIAGLVVARGSNMKMYLANLLPLSFMGGGALPVRASPSPIS